MARHYGFVVCSEVCQGSERVSAVAAGGKGQASYEGLDADVAAVLRPGALALQGPAAEQGVPHAVLPH